MIDFANMPKHEQKECQECGQQFTGFPDQPRCTQCHYLSLHPEEAPKYWTWTKRGPTWTIVATWPDREPLPEVGDVLTVHRRNGATSAETITEIDGLLYDTMGRGRLHCRV